MKKIGFIIIFIIILGYLLFPEWIHTRSASSKQKIKKSLVEFHLYLPLPPLPQIKSLLNKEKTLHTHVINKVMATLTCSQQHQVSHNQILTIIDYSLPSNQKRLWIFDLRAQKLLYHTYVSHGIKSGTRYTQFFSNKYNSKASSLGVYKANQTYYGRDGISLRVDGLDSGFNDNAANRAIVMHGGWYVEEDFIKKYGRAGRSWGCPAVSVKLAKNVLNTIKDDSLIVVYYPDDRWITHSKFLNCQDTLNKGDTRSISLIPPLLEESSERDPILFVDLNHNQNHEENEPVLVISAENYQRLFNHSAPLTRMLRRQIDQKEYIVLNAQEFQRLPPTKFETVLFVVPVLKMNRGYYLTQMQIVPLGKISQIQNDTLILNNEKRINIHSTNEFIRWIGL